MLHLFSGPQREGDLEYWFHKLGRIKGFDVTVINVDTCRSAGGYSSNGILNDEFYAVLLHDVKRASFI